MELALNVNEKMKESSSCPYAVALHSDDESESDNNASKLIQSCPAFQQGSCPFASCTDEDSVRKQLLQIPSSHYESGKGGPEFLRVLQEIHAVASVTASSVDKKFQLATCPVASKIPIVKPSAAEAAASKAALASINFRNAMEEFSLAAIMARMAEEMEKSEGTIAENSESSAGEPYEIKENQTTTSTITRSSSHLRLSESFKQGTAVSHQAAEDVHFVRNFIRGQIDRKLYAELVVQLFHVYNILEGCLDKVSPRDASLQKFQEFHDQLRRKETLQEDLDFWHGPAVTQQIVTNGEHMSLAAHDYVERLQFCADTDPVLLLAHSYTRYLGDLSGGKILARVARKAMNLEKTNHEGLAFYEFASIPSAKQFKDSFRTALDDLDLTDSEIKKLVGEANVAFLLNMRLFEELDVAANVPGASVRPLEEALNFANLHSQEDNAATEAKCPFATTGSTTAAPAGNAASTNKIPAECPFAKAGAPQSTDNAPVVQKKGRCPWPFIIAHDPVAALKDWQTWALVGLILCYVWSKLQQ